MRQDIAVVETSHCDLGDNHLEESREGREDTELIWSESESSGSREVTTLHDTRGDEDFWVLLVDNLEAS